MQRSHGIGKEKRLRISIWELRRKLEWMELQREKYFMHKKGEQICQIFFSYWIRQDWKYTLDLVTWEVFQLCIPQWKNKALIENIMGLNDDGYRGS